MTPGLVLHDRYRLVSELGDGGMGVVWRAYDLRLDAPVAVKLMHPQATANPDARARFEREAKAAANLRGPHVVQILEVGVDRTTSLQFIAMELLEGESLRERILRAGRLTPAEVARVVTHVARALSRAHESGVVHRDLKPANIFLVRNDDDEVAKVLDFGIAKWANQPLLAGSTDTGALLGTPYYMSPEQIGGSKGIDFRTDLWSLAVIAVECLTGRLPFVADNLPGLALLISQGRAALPSALGPVPHGFDQWFARATAVDPAGRFQSASELALELRTLCAAVESGRTITPGAAAAAARALEPTLPDPMPAASVGPLSSSAFNPRAERPRPRRWAFGAAALGGGVLLIVAAAVALQRDPTPRMPEPASASSNVSRNEPPRALSAGTESPKAPVPEVTSTLSLSADPAPNTQPASAPQSTASPTPSEMPAARGAPVTKVEKRPAERQAKPNKKKTAVPPKASKAAQEAVTSERDPGNDPG